jgi:hypothetical protein
VAASRYRIVLRGRLSERFESAFDGMTLEHGPDRTVEYYVRPEPRIGAWYSGQRSSHPWFGPARLVTLTTGPNSHLDDV